MLGGTPGCGCEVRDRSFASRTLSLATKSENATHHIVRTRNVRTNAFIARQANRHTSDVGSGRAGLTRSTANRDGTPPLPGAHLLAIVLFTPEPDPIGPV